MQAWADEGLERREDFSCTRQLSKALLQAVKPSRVAIHYGNDISIEKIKTNSEEQRLFKVHSLSGENKKETDLLYYEKNNIRIIRRWLELLK